MGREDIPYELIRAVFPHGSWKLATFEDLFKISVSLDQLRTLDLKTSLCKFRLKKHIPGKTVIDMWAPLVPTPEIMAHVSEMSLAGLDWRLSGGNGFSRQLRSPRSKRWQANRPRVLMQRSELGRLEARLRTAYHIFRWALFGWLRRWFLHALQGFASPPKAQGQCLRSP
jgi:hypothetical protein